MQIVGTTPLPGSGLVVRDVAANVQIYTAGELRRQGTGLTDFLERNATGITVNSVQGNPFQPDINVRGFSASPLLGTPQGISVFLDGVRINEPFGDGVNWDLIPQAAISSIQLIPGSNPAFGLNTLGGAIAVYTKSGARDYPDRPGGIMSLSAGSFGRRSIDAETGGTRGPWHWFVAGSRLVDSGWARHNPSQLRQAFAKLGWQDEKTELDLTLAAADNRLEGAQTLPASFDDIREPYTWPDVNTNRMGSVALKGSHTLAPRLLVSGNAYLRRFRNRNLSSNVDDSQPGGAVNDASAIDQTSRGMAIQLTDSTPLGGLANRLSIGLGVDTGRARFVRTAQPAAFTSDRGTVGSGDFEPDTDADSTTRHLGAFFSDSLQLGKRWSMSVAGRFNRADVQIADRSGAAPQLNGAHRFQRFNPALGLNFNPAPDLTLYSSYNEGMRAPTAIELTCADPQAPCKLPNSFVADPPLKKVVAKTVEIGGRGQLGPRSRWRAALFRTDLHDDLHFISSDQTALNAGYFQNVGSTRRQGLEVDGETAFGRLALALRYSFIDARFRSNFSESSPHNASADARGRIDVRSGDRIPSIPRQMLKLRLSLDATDRWQVGANALVSAGSPARGNENNADANGRVGGYAVLNLDTSYRMAKRWRVFGRVDNALNRRYANFAILGANVFTGPSRSFDPGNPVAEPFRGYGVPRAAFVGVQYFFE